tara:strand:+ start:368 stop:820 length:453 start_codon:yes stop_codon:yes gene_type:complete
MGGTDEPSNLIELSVEDHSLAHKKLYEQHGKQEDFMAWHMLKGQMDKDEALFMARSLGGKKKMSEESKAKLRASCKLRTERQRLDGTKERANLKTSKALTGRVRTAEHARNNRASRVANQKAKELEWHSDETKSKISEGLKKYYKSRKIL